MTNTPNKVANTLRLGKHELNKLLEQIERKSSGESNPEREFARWTYRIESVQLIIEHSSGNKVTLPVATRNISRGGISVLHSAYVHTKTPCQIILSLPDGEKQLIDGTVTRCTHIEGRVHEIGIKFKQQISTKDLLGLDPLHEAYSLECIEPSRLHGSVLIVTPSDMDRELLLAFLEDTSLAINTANTIENAVARAQKGCDLVVSDYHINEETGPDLVKAFKEAGCDLPVVILTSDKSESALDAIRESGASGILSKPASKDKLMRALAEFLLADGDGGPLYSTLTQNDSAFPLLGKFLTDVPRMALNLEKAMREDDEDACKAVTRTLAGTASPLGFDAISSLAIAADSKLGAGGMKNASAELRALIVACRRIKANPAA